MEIIVASRGRISIPAKIRKQLGIEDGTRLRLDVDSSSRRIILTPVTREYVRSLRGRYKGSGLMKSLMAEKATERG